MGTNIFSYKFKTKRFILMNFVKEEKIVFIFSAHSAMSEGLN